MRYPVLILILAIACIMTAMPALAQENPYRNAGETTALDVPVTVGTDGKAVSDTSAVTFDGAGYTHTIGRVTIRIVPLLPGLDTVVATDGNRRTSGTGNTVTYEVYRDLIKESITLKSPDTISYSYDLRLSDWVTTEPDESRPEKTIDANNTVHITYPHTKQVTNYAKDSTIDINPDRWGNLVVYINGEDIVVMPKPYAIDAAGKRFELDFKLDKNSKTISLGGDLSGAQYPLVIDPTERVTNGGFETGNLSGWTGFGGYGYYSVVYGGAYAGDYYLNVQGTGGYSGISQNVNYTGTTSVSNAGAVPVVNYYDVPMSDIAVSGWNWLVNIPGQYVQNWTVRSTTPGLTGSGNIVIWTYSSTHGHVDSVKLDPAVWTPPVADFTASPTSGTVPFTVQFTDTSTNSPTSWSWTFGDGGTSYLQNPSHQYTTAGTHNVTLTATNSDGSCTKIKPAYIMGTGGTYTVIVDGVTDYHGWQDYLGEAVPLASSFYSTIAGTSGDTTWTGYYEHYNDDTGSKYWNVSESSAIKADNADFALFAGHGWDDRIYFGTNNSVRELVRGDMEFGESKAKWVTLSACRVLNQTYWTNWKPVFNGLHILNGYDTIAWLDDDQGTQFAQRMKGSGGYSVHKIRDAWRATLEETINVDDTYSNGAWMWAEPCKDDYLPGYGTFCSAPIVEGNGYNVSYGYFDCL